MLQFRSVLKVGDCSGLDKMNRLVQLATLHGIFFLLQQRGDVQKPKVVLTCPPPPLFFFVCYCFSRLYAMHLPCALESLLNHVTFLNKIELCLDSNFSTVGSCLNLRSDSDGHGERQ